MAKPLDSSEFIVVEQELNVPTFSLTLSLHIIPYLKSWD